MIKLFKNYKLEMILASGSLFFLLIANTAFADKLQFGGFYLENNPVNV